MFQGETPMSWLVQQNSPSLAGYEHAYKIAQFTIPPGWNSDTSQHDIALIRLERNVADQKLSWKAECSRTSLIQENASGCNKIDHQAGTLFSRTPRWLLAKVASYARWKRDETAKLQVRKCVLQFFQSQLWNMCFNCSTLISENKKECGQFDFIFNSWFSINFFFA